MERTVTVLEITISNPSWMIMRASVGGALWFCCSTAKGTIMRLHWAGSNPLHLPGSIKNLLWSMLAPLLGKTTLVHRGCMPPQQQGGILLFQLSSAGVKVWGVWRGDGRGHLVLWRVVLRRVGSGRHCYDPAVMPDPTPIPQVAWSSFLAAHVCSALHHFWRWCRTE